MYDMWINLWFYLTTSNGLDVIEHNHQEISDGKYITKTDTAKSGQTKSLKNWALTWRAYDDRAGGLSCSNILASKFSCVSTCYTCCCCHN